MRIFSVTGTGTARTVASRIAAAAVSSRISAEPACCPSATFFTGQPKLMSIRSAPRSTASRAASAIAAGSQPASCTALMPPQPSTSAIASVFSIFTDHRPGGDHLRHHHAGTELLGEMAKWQIGDTGHRREDDRRVDPHATTEVNRWQFAGRDCGLAMTLAHQLGKLQTRLPGCNAKAAQSTVERVPEPP